jgi:hypothetical protein
MKSPLMLRTKRVAEERMKYRMKYLRWRVCLRKRDKGG